MLLEAGLSWSMIRGPVIHFALSRTSREDDDGEGERRRARIEALIGELDARRDGALRDLERLRGELASTIEKHKSSARSDRRNGGEDGEPAKAAKTAKTVAKP